MDEEVGCFESEMCRPSFKFLLCLAVISTLQGCGGLFEADQPVNISGRVSYQGQILAEGVVLFSQETAFGIAADAVATNLSFDGYFVVNESGHAGLPPGYYRIAISGRLRNGFHIPRRYHDPNTSGLRCKVDSGQPLDLLIELE
jgi:hypothetical protein